VDEWGKKMRGSAMTGAPSALANPPSRTRSVFTLVPGHRPIELVAYYREFVGYYPECELQTKRWFLENMRRDWVCFENEAPRGVIRTIISNFNEWNQSFSKIFWIQPSWMLVGIKA
jgi:hypothetical protein